MEVRGCGNPKAKMMLVGEAPAKNEETIGKPFQGPAGQELDRLLANVGISRDDLWITNASLERVQGKVKDDWFFEKDGRPTQVLMRGLAALMEDVNRIRPNVIVPMGNYALWAVRQHKDIMRWRGSILPSALMGGTKVVPTIHPSALLRHGGEVQKGGLYKYRPVILWDLERAKEQSAFPDIRLTPRTYLIDNRDSLRRFYDTRSPDVGVPLDDILTRLHAAKRLTFDVETGRWNKKDPFVIPPWKCISFSDYDPNWSVTFWVDGYTHPIIKELLESKIPKYGQNLMFDATYCDTQDVYTENVVFDTMLAQHVILTDLPKGLDFLCSVHTDIPYYKDEGKTWKERENPANVLMTYCCKDNCGTTETAQQQTILLKEDDRLMRTFKWAMLMFQQCRRTTTTGVPVDRPLLHQLMQEAREGRDLRQAIVDGFAGRAINVFSHPQVKKVIYEERGLPPRTINKKLTTKANVLMDLAAKTDDPILVAIVKTRKWRKLLSSYYNERVISFDGRIRWEYKIAGTKTGRLSCQKPTWGPGLNGQTIPPAARRLFLPEPGYEFCEVDQAQAEAVITAAYADDPIHLDAFRTGKDVHRVTACMLQDMDLERWKEIPKDSKIRQLSKKCNHAFNYGMGAPTFCMTVNNEWDPDDPDSLRITSALADSLHAKYHEKRPALKAYWMWVESCLSKTRTLETCLGRVRQFLDQWSDSMLKDGYSWVPQATVGQSTNMGLIRVLYHANQVGLNIRLVAQTHDSALWTYPKECRDEVVKLVLGKSEVPLYINGMLLTVPVEAMVGDSWYKLHPNDPADYKGLHFAGASRKTIDLTGQEYQEMQDEYDTILKDWKWLDE